MNVCCPACSARFRLDRSRLGGKRLTLRCSRCRQVFKVEVPASCEATAACRVLVAHSDESLCTTIGELLASSGLPFNICHSGNEALRCMEAAPPQVALIDVALPGLFAFEVVEKVRSRPALSETKIILLSSVYNRTAYKRRPTSLYGADDYIEKHHLADDLIPKINRLATILAPCVNPGCGPAPEGDLDGVGCESEKFSEFSAGINDKLQFAEKRETCPETSAEAVEKARRLARIIVSDIALYNQERIDEGIRTDSSSELLAAEIAEGRRLFEERVAADIRGSEDFLQTAFAALIERRRRELRL